MCLCCSVRQQKIWVFSVGTVLLAIGIFLILWSPNFVNEKLFAALPLTPTSTTFDNWQTAPIPIYMYMYLFNWTNPEDVRTPNVKPNFEKVGPYVFRELKTKEDIIWNENKTMTFLANRTWFFEPDMSGGDPDDLVTCPHIPTIAAASAVRDKSKVIKYFLNSALNRNGGALYQTHTAMEWLFDGYYDEFLDYAMKLNNSLTGSITSNRFAFFLNRNGSKEFEGSYNIDTGQNDLSQLGELKLWKGEPHTGFYEGECGRINGSTGDIFVPNRSPDEFITVFVTDTCRIINLEPTNEKVVIEGITTRRYETTPSTFDNGQSNEDMKCFCPTNKQPDNCPKPGVTDLGPCADGAPMYLSHPNFMYADESYADTVTGLNPNYDEDAFYILIEPKLGIPLEVRANVQVSLYIQSDPDITLLKNLPDFYAPFFITASHARVDKALAKQIRFILYLPDLGRNIGIALVVIGGVMIAIGIALTMTRRWRGQKKDIYPPTSEAKANSHDKIKM